MSILIRKQCQEHLDAAGLGVTHVDINNKTLAIVGECGQPLVSINGIRFATNNPTKAEVAYAVELFVAFLEKHKAKLQNLIKLKKQLAETEKPIYSGKGSHPYTHRTNEIKFDLKKGELVYNVNGSIRLNTDLNAVSLAEIEALKEVYDADVAPYMTALNAYQELENAITHAKSEINKCDI